MKQLLKRTLSGLLTLCLLLGFFPVRPVRAASYGDLYYGFCGPANSEIFIMDCNTTVTGTVVIPENINGLPVTRIDSGAFKDCIGMTELSIPNTVTTIHANAFTGCDNLTYNFYDNGRYLGNKENPYQALISISNEQSTYTVHPNTTAFASDAFQGTDVTSVTLPSGVTMIPNGAFKDCTQLTTVGVTYNLTSIGASAFENCTSLTDVQMGYRLEYLGNKAFKNCTSLTGAYISDKVPDIYYETFYNCSSLRSVTIGSGVTGIGDHAFYNCSSLTSVRIPDSVTSIGRSAFVSCKNLTSVTLPAGITSIKDYTFEYCEKLSSINIPEGVTYIGYHAFYQCYDLAYVNIPASVKTIGSDAFGSYTACSTSFTVAADNPSYSSDDYGVLFNKDQTSMLHVPRSIEGVYAVPQTVTEIPDYAFRNCTGLTGVTIPDHVTQIGDNAFSLCEKLTAITIPASVTGMGEYVFYNCPALRGVAFLGSAPKMGSHLFRYTDLTICYPGDDASWTEEVKQSCGASLTWQPHACTYTSNGDVTCTEDGTMSGVCEYCGNTLTVTDPAPGHQFVDNVCTVCGLKLGAGGSLSYSIENGAVTITGCDTGLTGALKIPDTVDGYPVTHIADHAFVDCTGLTEIIIPDSVISIGTDAFLNCNGMTGITVAAENPVYSSDAYGVLLNKDQTVLIQAPVAITGVYPVPTSVTSIGANAFSGCTGLTTVSFPETAPAIGENAFANVTANICYNEDSWTADVRQNYGGTLSWQPHSGSFTSNGDATCAEPGTMTGVCDHCDITVTVTEPALGHQYVDNICSVCGERSRNYSSTYKTADFSMNYTVEDGNVTITFCQSIADRVKIPDTIDGYPVTNIGDHAFSVNRNMTSVIIPNSVTTIGYSAFNYCIGLTSVVIPEGVTEIGDYAFYECNSLTKVMIAGSVTKIGLLAFAGCDIDRHVYFWGDAPTFGGRPFGDVPDSEYWYDTYDTKIYYRSDAKGWTDSVKANCDINLTWIEYNVSGNLIYEIVVDIWGDDPSYAKITGWIGTPMDVVIPDKIQNVEVTEITADAFQGCNSLTGVTIGRNITELSVSTFYGCDNLTGVWVNDMNPNWSSDASGVLFNKPKTTLIYAPMGISGAYAIPESVTGIQSGAFSDCSQLTAVTIPASVTSIGENVFTGCDELNYNVYDNANYLGNAQNPYQAILGISDDQSTYVIHPDTTVIASDAFKGTNVISVTISDNVTVLPSSVFDGCSKLTSITFLGSAPSIGSYAFRNVTANAYHSCTDGTWTEAVEQNYGGTITWVGHLLGNFVNHRDATCTQNAIKMGRCSQCGAEETVSVPKTATGHSYGDYVYNEDATCTQNGTKTRQCQKCGVEQTTTAYGTATGHSYEVVITPPTCTEEGFTAHTCSGCGDSYMTDTVPATGHQFVDNVCTLCELEVPSYTTTQGLLTYQIGNGVAVLTKCGSDAAGELTIPAEVDGFPVTMIGNLAFDHRASLDIVNIPDSVTHIGERAFWGCFGLDSITIPDSVTYIGNGAFLDCSGLACAVISNGIAAIGDETFKNCTKLTSVSIPDSVTMIGDDAFRSCSALTSVDIPGSVESIGSQAFAYCHALTEVTLPEGVTTIKEIAFAFCEKLTTVTIPASATKLERLIFMSSFNLRSVYFMGDAPVNDESLFSDAAVTVYYHEGNQTWTDEVKQSYGTATWASTHFYEDGLCTVCGAKPSVQPTLTLKSPSLEFRDMVRINALFTAENTEDVVEMGMITYSFQVETWNVENAGHVIPGAIFNEGTGRYIATSQGIHAKYLGDTVYLAVYAKLSDGSYAYSKLVPYSAVQYATNQLKNSTDMKLKQLVVSMLNYGTEAQRFFKHNTGSLANASLNAEQAALPEAYRADMIQSVPNAPAKKQGSFASNKGFSGRMPAVSFEGAFCINYFFTPKYAPVDGITLYYWNEADYTAAEVLTAGNATGSMKLEGRGTEQYSGTIQGISARDLSQAVYVAAVYSDGTNTWTSGVLGYSIGAYCASQADKGTTLSDLTRAAAVYGYSAKQYFG